MKDKLYGELRICIGFDLVWKMRKDVYEEVIFVWRFEGLRGIYWGWRKIV